MRTCFVAAVLALAVAAGLSAQSKTNKNAPANPLVAGRDLICTFPQFAAAVRWDADGPDIVTDKQDFSFGLTAIDTKKHNAMLVAGKSAEPVSIVVSPIGLHIVEQTPGGNMTVTSIFLAGRTGDRFLAVHSRHLGYPTAPPSVSLAYGTC